MQMRDEVPPSRRSTRREPSARLCRGHRGRSPRSTQSRFQFAEARLRLGKARLALDGAFEHLHRTGLVALLRADLAEVIEDLALRYADGRVELLEKERLEGLRRAIEIVRLERE